MANIPVEKKRAVPWWLIFFGALLLGVFGWVIYDTANNRAASTEVNQPTFSNSNAVTPNVAKADANINSVNANTQTSTSPDRITDVGVYVSTADKLSLAGSQAAFDGLRVVRIVGPRTFTVASGGEELFVIIDDGLDQRVGTQGDIDMGRAINLSGTFERLGEKEINDISDRRFRRLTEQERATLRNTQIYLHANQLSKAG